MHSDIALVTGLVMACFSITSMISALSDRYPPRFSAVASAFSCALIVYASFSHPEGYSVKEVPDVFVRVIARILN